MTSLKERIEYLQDILKKASNAYYNKKEFMSNKEYDNLFDELLTLEKETGYIIPDSITQNVGSEVVSSLPKITHEYPALSLAKTKVSFDLTKQMNKNITCHQSVLMWKLDGGTIIATYDNGKLTNLATRGNGIVGSDITHNAPHIHGLPQTISFQGHLVVRGEALMTYSEFNRINASLPLEEQYKNPRNLANASISLLDSNELRQREIQFYAFNLVAQTDKENKTDIRPNNFSNRLHELKNLGFQVVKYELLSNHQIESAIISWTDKTSQLDYPVDGLVIASEDAAYAEKQPGTGHNPNNLVGFAFKWQDELVQTHLQDIEWSVGRTGIITPVAIFNPIELCGTTVSRASLHNLSEMERILGTPYKEQELQVYKANMIIPQVDSGTKLEELDIIRQNIIQLKHPINCPCCHKPTKVRQGNNGVQVLICENKECPSKLIGALTHFCSRDCMNIVGMSEETLTKLINANIIHDITDIFSLDKHPEIAHMEGFGQTSWNNLCQSIHNARKTSFVPFIHALGIPNIGKGQAKLLNQKYHEDVMTFFFDIYSRKSFQRITGIGEILEQSLWDWGNQYLQWIAFQKEWIPANIDKTILALIQELTFAEETIQLSSILEGKTFVITGDVYHFKNRDELTAKIESLGGKVSGSVSSKTNYLINNNTTSTSGKNQKAQQLHIPIINEEEFLLLINEKDKTKAEMERE